MWDALCVKSLTLLKSANVICDSAQLHCCCYCCTATALLLLHICQLEASGAAAALPSRAASSPVFLGTQLTQLFLETQTCPQFHLESKTDVLPSAVSRAFILEAESETPAQWVISTIWLNWQEWKWNIAQIANTRWSLYLHLDFCGDHLCQHTDNREIGYSNVRDQLWLFFPVVRNFTIFTTLCSSWLGGGS